MRIRKTEGTHKIPKTRGHDQKEPSSLTAIIQQIAQIIRKTDRQTRKDYQVSKEISQIPSAKKTHKYYTS